MTDNEIIKMYAEKYLEGFNKGSHITSYPKRKDYASEYAGKWCPEGKLAIKELANCLSNGGIKTDKQWLGHKITIAIRRLGLKPKKVKVPVEDINELEKPSLGLQIEQKDRMIKKLSAVKLYTAWCQNNDYVPSDKCLEHFTLFSWNTFGGARAKLTQEGYKFENLSGQGWKIVERPTKTEVTKADIEAKVSEVLGDQLKLFIPMVVNEMMKRLNVKGE